MVLWPNSISEPVKLFRRQVSGRQFLNCHYSRKLALTQPLLSKAVSAVHGEIFGMDPRKFLGFFKSKTGKIILFLGLIGIGCVLYHGFAPPAKTTKPEPAPNLQGAPEKNQPTSVDRGGSRFIIPGFLSLREQNNGGTNSAPTNAPPVLPISLYNSDDGEAQVSEEYAPYGRLIPCETIITIDSAKIETPIIGFVTEDVYHDGKLIIPAGAEVHGKAQVDPSRERIASEDNWYIVWRTTDRLNGAELPLHGVALDMERDYRYGTWALTDGSAGLRGDILKTDNWAEIKLFAATFISAAATGLQQTQQSTSPLTGATQQIPLSTPQNAALQGSSAVLNQYAQQIADSIKRDGFYVRVQAGKQFYLYVMQTIDLEKARQGESTLSQEKPENKPTPQQP